MTTQSLVDVSQIFDRIIAQRIDYLAILLANIAGNGTTTGTGSVVLNNSPSLVNPSISLASLIAVSEPSTPPSGVGYLYLDSSDGSLRFKGANGNVTIIANS